MASLAALVTPSVILRAESLTIDSAESGFNWVTARSSSSILNRGVTLMVESLLAGLFTRDSCEWILIRAS